MKTVIFEFEGESHLVKYYVQGVEVRITDVYKLDPIPESAPTTFADRIAIVSPATIRLVRTNVSFALEQAFKEKYTPMYVAKEITK